MLCMNINTIGMSIAFFQRGKVFRRCLKLGVLLFLAVTPMLIGKVWWPVSNTLIVLDTEPDPRTLLSTNLSTIKDSSETIGAYVATPSGVCDQSRTFLVYVLAQPTEFERRDVIRRTWANTLH